MRHRLSFDVGNMLICKRMYILSISTLLLGSMNFITEAGIPTYIDLLREAGDFTYGFVYSNLFSLNNVCS